MLMHSPHLRKLKNLAELRVLKVFSVYNYFIFVGWKRLEWSFKVWRRLHLPASSKHCHREVQVINRYRFVVRAVSLGEESSQGTKAAGQEKRSGRFSSNIFASIEPYKHTPVQRKKALTLGRTDEKNSGSATGDPVRISPSLNIFPSQEIQWEI